MKVTLRRRKLRDGRRETLYLDYGHSPHRFQSLGIYLDNKKDSTHREQDKEKLRVAEAIAAQRQLEIVSQQYGLPLPDRHKADFLPYARRLGEKQRAANTRIVFRNAIQQLETFAKEQAWERGVAPAADGQISIAFAQVTHEFLDSFKEFLLKRVQPSSAGVYLARIKTACRQAVEDRFWIKDPAQKVTIKKQKRRKEFLTLEELRKLAMTPCGNRDTKRAFLFACFSGLRWSDVKALTWPKVRQVDGKYILKFVMAKTDEPQWLPLGEEAAAILEGQKTAHVSPRITRKVPSDAVFKLGAQQTVDKTIKRWVKRTGIDKKISFHKSRHTHGTLALTYGVDIYAVKELLGHHDLATTEDYVKLIDQKKQEAVAKLPRLKVKF